VSNHLFHILLAEDNPGDARLTMEALKDGRFLCQVHLAKDGVEAMEFLRREGRFADAPRPDLMFLDLNMPRKDGREVLEEMKEDPALRRIPVVVLTTSEAEQDLCRSYDLHANCYIIKPLDVDQFFQIVRAIEDFWFSIVRLAPA
jgi:CheY-like chemotaxis protein